MICAQLQIYEGQFAKPECSDGWVQGWMNMYGMDGQHFHGQYIWSSAKKQAMFAETLWVTIRGEVTGESEVVCQASAGQSDEKETVTEASSNSSVH